MVDTVGFGAQPPGKTFFFVTQFGRLLNLMFRQAHLVFPGEQPGALLPPVCPCPVCSSGQHLTDV